MHAPESHAPARAYYVALQEQVLLEGTCPRCNTFSSECLKYDVCPTCEAYDAEHGCDVDLSGAWL